MNSFEPMRVLEDVANMVYSSCQAESNSRLAA